MSINSSATQDKTEDGSVYGEQKLSYMRKQSMMMPDKKEALLNYDLEAFQNSMWENFLGSQVQISETIDLDDTSNITNQNVDKMGPI